MWIMAKWLCNKKKKASNSCTSKGLRYFIHATFCFPWKLAIVIFRYVIKFDHSLTMHKLHNTPCHSFVCLFDYVLFAQSVMNIFLAPQNLWDDDEDGADGSDYKGGNGQLSRLFTCKLEWNSFSLKLWGRLSMPDIFGLSFHWKLL